MTRRPPPLPPRKPRQPDIVPEAAYDIIKEFEGLRLEAYKDAVGVWTIGYGHTRTAKPGMVITETEADALLAEDANIFARGIKSMVKVPLNDHQFSALVSWSFNVGLQAARRSTLVRKLNDGDYASVPGQLARWKYAGGKVLRGLVRRRAAEGRLWETPMPEPAPTTPETTLLARRRAPSPPDGSLGPSFG